MFETHALLTASIHHRTSRTASRYKRSPTTQFTIMRSTLPTPSLVDGERDIKDKGKRLRVLGDECNPDSVHSR